MHFGILQRAEATQRRIRTLMKVHPEMIGDVSYATKNDIEALDRECQETHGESMERLRLRLSSYNLNAFYYSPLCWNRRQAIREQAKCWRSFWPRLRKEIDYLEEKWIFELMQRHSYQVDSETYFGGRVTAKGPTDAIRIRQLQRIERNWREGRENEEAAVRYLEPIGKYCMGPEGQQVEDVPSPTLEPVSVLFCRLALGTYCTRFRLLARSCERTNLDNCGYWTWACLYISRDRKLHPSVSLDAPMHGRGDLCINGRLKLSARYSTRLLGALRNRESTIQREMIGRELMEF